MYIRERVFFYYFCVEWKMRNFFRLLKFQINRIWVDSLNDDIYKEKRKKSLKNDENNL